MGLRIVAHSNLRPVGLHTDNVWCDTEGHVVAFAYATFLHSFRGVPVLGTYSSRGEFINGGCYAFTDATVDHTFSAGSYKGYGEWRANLAQQFNPETHPELPFYDLIHFADNEGCIGPESAADLLADFQLYAHRYQPPVDDIFGWYPGLYAGFTRACELAAESGLIRFR